MWESGVILHVNAPAAALGATRGMSVRVFAAAIVAATSAR
jgi:hypothetical protein